jgi:hypothetical protein
MKHGEMGLKVANAEEFNQSANLHSEKVSIGAAAKMLNAGKHSVIRKTPE